MYKNKPSALQLFHIVKKLNMSAYRGQIWTQFDVATWSCLADVLTLLAVFFFFSKFWILNSIRDDQGQPLDDSELYGYAVTFIHWCNYCLIIINLNVFNERQYRKQSWETAVWNPNQLNDLNRVLLLDGIDLVKLFFN